MHKNVIFYTFSSCLRPVVTFFLESDKVLILSWQDRWHLASHPTSFWWIWLKIVQHVDGNLEGRISPSAFAPFFISIETHLVLLLWLQPVIFECRWGSCSKLRDARVFLLRQREAETTSLTCGQFSCSALNTVFKQISSTKPHWKLSGIN